MQYAILLLSGSKFSVLQGKIYNTIRMYSVSLCGSHNFCENIKKWKQTSFGIDFARCKNKEIQLILYHLVV